MEIVREFDFDCPVERLWAIYAAGDELAWVSAGEVHVDKQGSGANMVRTLYWGGERDPTVFRVQILDHQARRIRYAIDSNDNMPLRDHTLEYAFSAIDEQHCRRRLTMRFTLPEGMNEEDTIAVIDQSIQTAVDNLRKRLAQENQENDKPAT